jgi:hypothetical protein
MITKVKAKAAVALLDKRTAQAWNNHGELWIGCRVSQRKHVESIFGKPARVQSQNDGEGNPVSLCMIYKIGA